MIYLSFIIFLAFVFLFFIYLFLTYFFFRAGQLTAEEIEKIQQVLANPRQYNIPDWFLNRKKDIKDGKYLQAVSNVLDTKMREDLEMMKKMRLHRGLRHYWGLKVRGQHTKATGRHGKTIGVAKTKAAQSGK